MRYNLLRNKMETTINLVISFLRFRIYYVCLDYRHKYLIINN
ncbi:hypothetical protein CNEO4_690014 [Clostridium neonatale]|nr:hypothetical protein CNEO4_720006 [Clostridium neonatale]CAI3694880.1 hypothetical protein CNEO4_690014 [Clostridium neonatale]CAI4141514.1 hypothetical protein CNEO4_720006 [Clostridium neonatale]